MSASTTNADYPDHQTPHAPGQPFPAVNFTEHSCSRIRMATRVLDPATGKVSNVRDVIIPTNQPDRGYVFIRDIRDAIFGRVYHGWVINCIHNEEHNTDWEFTGIECAIKEMGWKQIHEARGQRADDPIQEANAMQYAQHRFQSGGEDANDVSENVTKPLDILSDEICLFIVLPFCNGGELFDRLANNGLFTEGEARLYIRQVLNGIAAFQSAGMSHRDISLENVLIHNNSCKIIDLGMCLLIPYTTVDGRIFSRGRENEEETRLLLSPSGRRGKQVYMAPEIYRNVDPFDGFAVDLWAVAVMLFTMVTGFHPWKRPARSDAYFRFIAWGGLLNELFTEWEVDLSSELVDLLQSMLYEDPTRRLCLEQVLDHPWMTLDLQW